MRNKKHIESVVSEYFKIPVEEIYEDKKKSYPYNGAKLVMMYMLYKYGMKVYSIAGLFDISGRMAYHSIAQVSVALRSDTKLKEDIENIENLLTNKKQ